jgi:hypothetical protein
VDIEQLRLVLEAINGAGEGAKEFGMWWLAARTIPSVLLFVFGMTAVVMIARQIAHGIHVHAAAYELARELDHPVMVCWDASDTNDCLRRLRKLKETAGKS